MKDYQKSIAVNNPAHEVYKAITEHIPDWWSEDFSGAAAQNQPRAVPLSAHHGLRLRWGAAGWLRRGARAGPDNGESGREERDAGLHGRR